MTEPASRIEPTLVRIGERQGAPQLSATRLKTILTIFIVVIVLAGTGITLGLVWRVFQEFDASVLDDLRWKTIRVPREIAAGADVALALGDAAVVGDSFADYRNIPNVQAVIAVDPKGKIVAQHGQAAHELGTLFGGAEGDLREGDGSLWSWRRSTIEGREVGRVAVVVSKQRLRAGFVFRNRILFLAGGGCVVAIFASFFVTLYLGPLLRFAEDAFEKALELNATLEQRVGDRTAALTRANADLEESLQRLHSTQAQLLDASRRAGMADVASTVLHNVGNVLNSVNISSEMLLETIKGSSLDKLDKVAEMLRAHAGNLEEFLVSDPKGRKLAPFLLALAEASGEERRRALTEAQSLRENVDHIKNIVSRQQEFTRARVGVTETVVVDDLVDIACKMVAPSFERRGVEIVRVNKSRLRAEVDRHKILEVMVNVLTNARQAVEDNGGAKTVEISISRKRITSVGRFEPDRVVVEIADNGYGIAAGDMTRLFEQGFTTKKTGQGLGLHGSACAMMEMAGALRAHSDGRGRGATFIIELVAAAAQDASASSSSSERLVSG